MLVSLLDQYLTQCPKTKTALAKKFEDWWVAPATHESIASFKLEGKQLFFPNAGK